jgi:hypothetical protein
MSSTKKLITPFRLFDSVDISASQLSAEVVCSNQDTGIAFISWSGTSPVGVVTFEFLEVDYDRNATNAPVWQTVDLGSTMSVSGASGSHTVVFNALPFFKLRARYTRTSGTGNLSVTFAAKEG